MVTGYQVPSITAEGKSEPFPMQLARGLIAGHSKVDKFGSYDAVGTSFVPVTEGGIYRTPMAAVTLEAISADANDTAAGTGAQEITLIGLDANWNEVTETVEMNGDSASSATTNGFIRLYRAYVSRSGTYATVSAGSHAGSITIRESGAGDTWTTIPVAGLPRGQSNISAFSVAKQRVGFIHSLFIHVDSNKAADILLMQRPNADDVVAPFSGALRTVRYLVGVTSTSPQKPWGPFGPFPGPSDVIMFAKVGSGSAAVAADFELSLVETE